jgi:mannose-6-phosphate isomerase-like protein (cupin superfamily)
MQVTHWTLKQTRQQLAGGNDSFFAEVFSHGTLRLGLYEPRERDPQQPHTQDEVYVVHSGSGVFVNGEERHRFGPGDAIFVPAGREHRFEEFTDDLSVWVVFYGPDGGEASSS